MFFRKKRKSELLVSKTKFNRENFGHTGSEDDFNKATIHFITFADGSDDIRGAGERLKNQSESSHWFNTSTIYNLQRIKEADKDWWNKHIDFIASNTRGLGFWIWKPKVISLQLQKANLGDYVVYADAGYEINILGINRFRDYIALANQYGFLTWEIRDQDIGTWTKGDTLNYFSAIDDNNITKRKQREFNLQVIHVTNETREFYEALSEVTVALNYKLVDDSPSFINNESGFIDHRHDQAIATLFSIKEKKGIFLPHEGYLSEYWNKGIHPAEIPFATLRNKTSKSKLIYKKEE